MRRGVCVCVGVSVGEIVLVFFFLKQKAAYEVSACLVGSEMCIGDRTPLASSCSPGGAAP